MMAVGNAPTSLFLMDPTGQYDMQRQQPLHCSESIFILDFSFHKTLLVETMFRVIFNKSSFI
jgi:hypothetical protein